MAKLLADSFDIGDLGINGPWAANSFGAISGTSRFGVGRSYAGGGPSNTTSNVFANSSNVIWLNFAFLDGSAASFQWTFYDGGTAQFTIEILNTSYMVQVRNGAVNSTVIASSPPNLYVHAVWHHWQIMVVLSKTVGEVHVRKDGNPVDDWSVTGINTQNGTVNARVNQMNVYMGSNGWMDDLLVFDNTGVTPTTWTGDIRSIVMMPASATAQNDFISGISGTVQPAGALSGTAEAATANTLWVTGVLTPAMDMLVSKITLAFTTGFTGNVNACIYDNTQVGGMPGNVLATTVTGTNPPTITPFDLALTTPLLLTQGVAYRIGVNVDTACNFSGGTVNANWYKKTSVTFGTFPANPTGMTGNALVYSCILAYVPANYTNCREVGLFDGDTTYNWSNTVGAMDLYGVAPLPYTPIGIYHAQIRLATRKSDTGVRSAQSAVKSGATVGLGSSLIQSSNYTTYMQDYSVDPNTGAAWTVSALNAVQIGCKVSA